jgi:hypothetical protein
MRRVWHDVGCRIYELLAVPDTPALVRQGAKAEELGALNATVVEAIVMIAALPIADE